MATHILLVDDDPLLRRSLAFNLERHGYRVSTAASGEDALALADRDRPDLVLLDIGLPGMDGLDVLHRFKTDTVPVIFLTARRRELDEVLGLELGADDYVTKPFDLDILLARVKAVLRRVTPIVDAREDNSPLVLGDIVLDLAGHTVIVAGKPVDLAPREFDLLHALALAPNRVIPSRNLLASVWGSEYAGEPQVLYVHIRWLRLKLEVDPNHPQRIQTVRGVGYKLVPQED